MERKIQSVVMIVCLLVLSATSIAAQSGASQMQTDKARREAEHMWEQMVKAKGGRERLHAVTNVLLISGDKPKDMGIELYVYPDKSWRWTQAPPAPNFASVHMVNLDRNVYLTANNVEPRAKMPVEMTDWRRRAIKWEMLQGACAHLLETKWMQPQPLRVTRQRVGGKLMDVIETLLRDAASGHEERMDFVVEPELLLVYRVVQYYEGEPVSFYCFDDYAAVDGIQMPRRTGKTNYRFWNEQCRYPYALKAQFNVDYDKSIFERPPSVAAGPQAWKPKH